MRVKRTVGASGVLQKGVSGVSEVFGCFWCKGLRSLCVWRQNVLCEVLIIKDTVQQTRITLGQPPLFFLLHQLIPPFSHPFSINEWTSVSCSTLSNLGEEKKKEYRAAQTNTCPNLSVREVQHIWRGVLDADLNFNSVWRKARPVLHLTRWWRRCRFHRLIRDCVVLLSGAAEAE